MKNKNKLYIIIGILISLAFIIIIDFMFPIKESNKLTILLEKNSTLIDKLKNVEINYIADSEIDKYLVDERDKKTNEELNEEMDKKNNEDKEKKSDEKLTESEDNTIDKNSKNKEIKSFSKTQFEYNVNSDKIEIKKYNGIGHNIVVPKTIDGYEVSKVDISSFDPNKDTVFFPNTVNEIEGKIQYDNSNKTNFVITNVVILVTIVIFIISVLSLSNKNLEENFYNSILYILSFLYLVISFISCYKYRMIGILSNVFFVKIGITFLIYILLVISFRFYKNKLMNNER